MGKKATDEVLRKAQEKNKGKEPAKYKELIIDIIIFISRLAALIAIGVVLSIEMSHGKGLSLVFYFVAICIIAISAIIDASRYPTWQKILLAVQLSILVLLWIVVWIICLVC